MTGNDFPAYLVTPNFTDDHNWHDRECPACGRHFPTRYPDAVEHCADCGASCPPTHVAGDAPR
jgi:hypothetical protein